MFKVKIPPDQWSPFLKEFSLQHRHCLASLETHDLKTEETVYSRETPLRSIDLDLEDEKNPRINVTVELDNKIVKHILFRPSQLTSYRSEKGDEALRIQSVNTATTLHLRSREHRHPV